MGNQRCDDELVLPGSPLTVNCRWPKGHRGSHEAIDTWDDKDVRVTWDDA